MKYIVIDLEMNPLAEEYRQERAICRSEIIQIGAVILDESYQEIGSFTTLVKPRYNPVITDRIARLTGIGTQAVQSAPDFIEALDMFLTWCQSVPGPVQICQWSSSDLNQIQREMRLKEYICTDREEELLSDWCDFQEEYDRKLGVNHRVSLKGAMMYAGVDFEGQEHDALNDARNTGTLMRILRDPVLCKETLAKVIDAFSEKKIGGTLADRFDFSALLSV